MTEDTRAPPAGLLAGAALKTLEDTPPLTKLPVDPNYVEPLDVEAYAKTADGLKRRLGDTADHELPHEFSALNDFLVERVRALERALLPFATKAVGMANAEMCLAADGRPDDPGGGTWASNPPKGITLHPNAGLFYNACDVYGRARVQGHLEAIFKRVQESMAAQIEKDEHVENGGKVQ